MEIARFLAPATTVYGIFRVTRTILRSRSPPVRVGRKLRAAGSKVVFVGNDELAEISCTLAPALSDESRKKDVDAVRYMPDLLADAGITIWRRP